MVGFIPHFNTMQMVTELPSFASNICLSGKYPLKELIPSVMKNYNASERQKQCYQGGL